ncbi:MAG TPA: type II secretion system protein GspC [Polyangiales bacterium]
MASQRDQRLVRIAATVVTLLLSAMLTARGTTQLVAAKLLPAKLDADRGAARVRTGSSEPPPPTPVEIGRAVLERNIFDSQTGPMAWDAPIEVATTPEGEDPEGAAVDDTPGEPAPCGGNLRLVATTVVPRRPELSFASISTGVEGKTMLYRQGQSIEGHEVVGIREQRVFLRPSGRPLCQTAMFTPPPSAAPPPPPPPPPAANAGEERPPPAPKSSISEEELNAGITQVSDTNYSVSRTLLDKVLSAQSELMRAARVIPYEENGRVVGVKVYGIRRAALLGKLGIQNGDVLRTINGFDLSSPDSALEAYTKLRSMDQFSIAMIRRGQPRTMEYQVK